MQLSVLTPSPASMTMSGTEVMTSTSPAVGVMAAENTTVPAPPVVGVTETTQVLAGMVGVLAPEYQVVKS